MYEAISGRARIAATRRVARRVARPRLLVANAEDGASPGGPAPESKVRLGQRASCARSRTPRSRSPARATTSPRFAARPIARRALGDVSVRPGRLLDAPSLRAVGCGGPAGEGLDLSACIGSRGAQRRVTLQAMVDATSVVGDDPSRNSAALADHAIVSGISTVGCASIAAHAEQRRTPTTLDPPSLSARFLAGPPTPAPGARHPAVSGDRVGGRRTVEKVAPSVAARRGDRTTYARAAKWSAECRTGRLRAICGAPAAAAAGGREALHSARAMRSSSGRSWSRST